MQKENLPSNKIQGRYYKYRIINQFYFCSYKYSSAMVSPPPFLLVVLSTPSFQETENKMHSSTKYIKLWGVGFKHLCINKVGEQKQL